jgi:hypothetical protein
MSLGTHLSALISAIGADIKALFTKTGGSAVPIGFLDQKITVSKGAIGALAAGLRCSLWRATGGPAQAFAPTATEQCVSTTLGAQVFRNATTVNHIADVTLRNTNSNPVITLYDRLAHMGGLAGNVTTTQSVDVDVNALSIHADRIGNPSYTELVWFMEWYAATGSTAVTATVAVTYSDGSTGDLNAIALAATRPAANLIRLNEFVPTAKSNLGIRSVNTVKLSGTTGTAGNFGVTVAREIMTVATLSGSYPMQINYTAAAMPDVPNDACMWWSLLTSTTSTGVFSANMRLVRAP